MRSLEDLDIARSKAIAKSGGSTAHLTVSEQLLRQRGEAALDRLETARKSGDPIAVAKAKVAVTRIQSELQQTNSARGSLNDMRAALAQRMTGS